MSPVVGLTPATSPLPAQATPAVLVRRADPAPYGWQVLTVRRGDTLNNIAITYRTTVGVLITRNRIPGGGHFLAVGNLLWVPRAAPAPKPAAVIPPAAAAVIEARTATYVVRSGDTLVGIAGRYKVSLATLYALNKTIRTPFIQPGQQLMVPAPAARAREADLAQTLALEVAVKFDRQHDLRRRGPLPARLFAQPGTGNRHFLDRRRGELLERGAPALAGDLLLASRAVATPPHAR